MSLKCLFAHSPHVVGNKELGWIWEECKRCGTTTGEVSDVTEKDVDEWK